MIPDFNSFIFCFVIGLNIFILLLMAGILFCCCAGFCEDPYDDHETQSLQSDWESDDSVEDDLVVEQICRVRRTDSDRF